MNTPYLEEHAQSNVRETLPNFKLVQKLLDNIFLPHLIKDKFVTIQLDAQTVYMFKKIGNVEMIILMV